jgi:hypothetical protein
MEHVKAAFRKYGPYLMIEAIMPGGTLIALALYFYRSHQAATHSRRA